jgi:hypothetical protein
MSTSKKKIQLVLDEEAQTTLEALRHATGAASMAEVLRDALGVYNSLRDMLAAEGQNRRLALIDRSAGEMQELIIPSLMKNTAIVGGARSVMQSQPQIARRASQPTPTEPSDRAVRA